MRNRFTIIFSMFAFGLLVMLNLYRQTHAENLGDPLLLIDPAASNINIGELVTVTVELNGFSDVYGIDLTLGYNPVIVEVVDADLITTGTQILPGTCPAPDFVILNTAYNITGTIQYAVTQLLPTAPCNTGIAASITFLGISGGTSEITFIESTVVDSNTISITHTTQNGAITVIGSTATPSPTPTGTGTATPTNTPTLVTPSPTATNTPPTPTPTPTEGTPTPYPDAWLVLYPMDLTIPSGVPATLNVELGQFVPDVYGLEMELHFDPAALAIIDPDPGTTGIQIIPGECPQPDSVVINSVDPQLGSIQYVVTQLNPTPACTGGVVATIQFQCIAPNTSTQVSFTSSLIANSNGESIPHDTVNATVTCGANLYLPLIFKEP